MSDTESYPGGPPQGRATSRGVKVLLLVVTMAILLPTSFLLVVTYINGLACGNEEGNQAPAEGSARSAYCDVLFSESDITMAVLVIALPQILLTGLALWATARDRRRAQSIAICGALLIWPALWLLAAFALPAS